MDNSQSCVDVHILLDKNLLVCQLISAVDLNNLPTVLRDMPDYVIYGDQSTLRSRLIHFLTSPSQTLCGIQNIIESYNFQLVQLEQLPFLIQPSNQNPIQPLDGTINETVHFTHDLPFFKVMNTLLKPMYFKSITGCTNLNWNFYGLDLEIIKTLIEKCDLRIILRFEQVGQTSFNGRLPHNIKVTLNNQYCILPLLETKLITAHHTILYRPCVPIDLTEYIISNRSAKNALNVTWSNEPDSFVVGVYLTKYLTWIHLLAELKKRPFYASDRTKELIKKSMESETDVSIDSLFITIKDPVTNLRMLIPTRGDKCIHLQCFDAMKFISMNKIKETWSCPICKKPVKFNSMEIDEYFYNIVQNSNLSDECETIVLLKDGTWKEKKTNGFLNSCDSINYNLLNRFFDTKQFNLTQPVVGTSNETVHFALNQPFFKVIHTFLNPTCLKSCTGALNFKIDIYINQSIKYLIAEKKFKMFLRLEQDGLKSFNGRLPYNVKVSVNDHECRLPMFNTIRTSGHRITPYQCCVPIDMTEQVYFNTSLKNTLIISWSDEPCGFIAGVYLIKNLTWKNLLAELKKRPKCTSDKTKEIIKKSMESEADVGIESLFTTLMDPITKLRMKLPARGDKCIHLQCFDAIQFLQMNYQKQTWLCPLCKQLVEFETMEIDEFFLNVVQTPNLSKKCENIVLFRDGTWTEKKTNVFSSNYRSINNNEMITVTDSDDDSQMMLI